MLWGGGIASNLKSKFCLSLAVCGVLTSLSFGADSGINYQIKDGKIEKITGGNCTSETCAGVASETTATGGKVSIDTGDSKKNYSGGAGIGSATGNKLTMTKGEADEISGGSTQTGTATGNTLDFKGGTVNRAIGGVAYSAKELTGKGQVSGNTANMSGGTAKILAGGLTEGTGNVSGNTVNFTGGKVTSKVVGGGTGIDLENDDAKSLGAGDATGNTVNISGGTMDQADSGIAGGATGSGKATGNKVIIKNGNFTNASIAGGLTYTGEASGNIVEVLGGNFGANTDIVGANVMDSGKGINNTVVLGAEGLNLSNTRIYGADGGYDGKKPSDLITGNTLEVWNKGITVKSVGNFQNYYFILPTNIANGDTMLTVKEDVNLKGTNIGVAVAGSGSNPNKLEVGDKVTLIDAPSVTGEYKKGSVNAANSTIRAKQGISLNYDFSLNTEGGKKLVATLDKIGATEESKALSEGTVTGAAIVTEAGDTVAGKGMDAAVQATNQNTGNGGSAVSSVNPFSGMGASSSRRKTGSYVDTNSISFLIGVALGREINYGRIIVGPFFEAGFASYDTHNDLSDGSVVKGSGHTRYLGGGILARYELNKLKLGIPYVEGSVRVGRNKNSFNSSDIDADYDTSATYWGAHAGLGFIWDITESTNIDTYVKYFYNHIGGDSAVIKADPYDFEAVNSHKLSAGFRVNHEYETASKYTIAPYAGAGYEYEFSGSANAYTNGYAIDTPTLGGGSGKGEIGIVLGKSGSGLKADLGVAGYVGLRRGVAGNIAIKYEF